MAELQAQAIQLLSEISDELRIMQIIQFIQEIKSKAPDEGRTKQARKDAAFQRLEQTWDSIKQYYPNGFNAEEEYESAMRERYGSIS